MLSGNCIDCFVRRLDHAHAREGFSTEIILTLPWAFVPIAQNSLDQLALGSDGMNDVVTSHAVCSTIEQCHGCRVRN